METVCGASETFVALTAEMVLQAKDPLELEDAHVFQELVTVFNGRSDVISKLVALVQGN